MALLKVVAATARIIIHAAHLFNMVADEFSLVSWKGKVIGNQITFYDFAHSLISMCIRIIVQIKKLNSAVISINFALC